MDDLGELRAAVTDGRAGLFLSFGGQGTGWLPELREYWQDAEVAALVETCLEAMEEEVAFVDRAVALPLGFDVRTWLEEPSKAPPRRYLAASGVSIPMIFVTQVACLQALGRSGLDVPTLLAATRGLTGQSQGLFAACFVALARSGERRVDALRRFAKFAFYIGTRSQEVYPFLDATEEERELATLARGGRPTEPTPMAATAGLPEEELRRLVRRFNGKVAPSRRLHVSLRFSDERLVLSGDRLALAEFGLWNADRFAAYDANYVYVRASCPFHSVMMAAAHPRLVADFARVGFRFPGCDLALPVYSFFDGRNLQDDEDLALGLHLDVVVHPLDWSLALAPAGDDAVTHVLDFGPGSESRRLNQRLLAALGTPKPVVSANKLAVATPRSRM